MEDPSLIAGIAGAILGGAAGAGIGYFLSLPRPKMRIANIALGPVQPDIGDEKALARAILAGRATAFLRIDQDLVQASRDCDYIDSFQEYYQHPAQYTFKLFEANRDSERVRLLHKGIPDILKELKRTLYAGMVKEFILAWHPYQNIFWSQMLSEHARGSSDTLKSIALGSLGDPLHSIAVDSDGDYAVIFGRMNFIFDWSRKKSQKSIREPFAEKISKVFAHEHVDSLKLIVKFLEGVQWDDPTTNKISRLVTRELAHYSKLVVRGVINNGGRTPVSIAAKGKFSVESLGFEFQGAGSSTLRLNENIQVEMVVVKDNLLDIQHCLVIPGGGAVFFEAHSVNYLHKFDNAVPLKALFGSERICTLCFPRLDCDDSLTSEPIKFTSFSTDDIFRKD